MTLPARVCLAMTLSGLGLTLWLGIGRPSVYGPSIMIVFGLTYALLLAFPAFNLIKDHKTAGASFLSAFGLTGSIGYLVLVALLPFYTLSIQTLSRNEMLGFALTLIGATTLLLFGFSSSYGRTLPARLVHVLVISGFAGSAGALMAGNVQFAAVSIILLAFLLLFERFLFGRSDLHRDTILLSFAFPLVMLLTVRIGHGLAVPLIASFIFGFALSLPRAKVGSPDPRE